MPCYRPSVMARKTLAPRPIPAAPGAGSTRIEAAVREQQRLLAAAAASLEAAGVDPGAFTPPKRVKGSPPVYPESAARAGAQGLVRLECLIKDSGKVEACRITQKVRPAIDQAAEEAIRHWKYEPARVKEEPTSIVAEFVMVFALR